MCGAGVGGGGSSPNMEDRAAGQKVFIYAIYL